MHPVAGLGDGNDFRFGKDLQDRWYIVILHILGSAGTDETGGFVKFAPSDDGLGQFIVVLDDSIEIDLPAKADGWVAGEIFD